MGFFRWKAHKKVVSWLINAQFFRASPRSERECGGCRPIIILIIWRLLPTSIIPSIAKQFPLINKSPARSPTEPLCWTMNEKMESFLPFSALIIPLRRLEVAPVLPALNRLEREYRQNNFDIFPQMCHKISPVWGWSTDINNQHQRGQQK